MVTEMFLRSVIAGDEAVWSEQHDMAVELTLCRRRMGDLLQLAKDVSTLAERWGEQGPLVKRAKELVERAER